MSANVILMQLSYGTVKHQRIQSFVSDISNVLPIVSSGAGSGIACIVSQKPHAETLPDFPCMLPVVQWSCLVSWLGPYFHYHFALILRTQTGGGAIAQQRCDTICRLCTSGLWMTSCLHIIAVHRQREYIG